MDNKVQQEETALTTEEVKDATLVTTYEIGDETYYQADYKEYGEDGSTTVSTKLISGDTIKNYAEDEYTSVVDYIINGKEYKETYKYNENGGLDTLTYVNGSTEKYSYTKNNYIESVTKNGELSTSYEYDALGRLITEKDYANNTLTEYSYDMCDNIQSIETYNLKKEKKGKLISKNTYKYSESYGDQLVEFNGEKITYDKSGNPVNYIGKANLSWNGKQLVSFVQDGKKVELTYDANGIINCKKVNGKDTIYDIEGKDYIREVRDEKELIYVYDSKANVVGFMYEGNNYYYVKNCLGDIIAIVDSDYKELCTYVYDARGNIITITGDKDIAKLNP